ncbi:Uncharacterised protein [Mycobacteroides abscessus subsp. abscessus]|nr:Uncharacterised protein [Mycobacteroides abscessus subsp. abscessus]SIE16823.1 Uncharacterised protein [Mycobacteroides abscessus subsp. abscessus]
MERPMGERLTGESGRCVAHCRARPRRDGRIGSGDAQHHRLRHHPAPQQRQSDPEQRPRPTRHHRQRRRMHAQLHPARGNEQGTGRQERQDRRGRFPRVEGLSHQMVGGRREAQRPGRRSREHRRWSIQPGRCDVQRQQGRRRHQTQRRTPTTRCQLLQGLVPQEPHPGQHRSRSRDRPRRSERTQVRACGA